MLTINYLELTNRNLADFLLITATDVETQALHSLMDPICDDGLLEIVKDGTSYYAGILGGYNIIHCQCSIGTLGKSGSTLKTTSALNDWLCIKAVVMVGIAFGMYDGEAADSQHYSDVLIASSIFPYENQRLNNDGSVSYRGNEHYPEKSFIDAFAIIGRDWSRKNIFGEPTKIEIAPLLSGEKLVDNIDRRNELRSAKPECRGGEMEGVGVAIACEKFKKPWILLKGICDFADGNKKDGKKEKQVDAARAAVLACINAFHTVNVGSIIGSSKTEFWYRPHSVDLNTIFFMHYEAECAPYYLVRRVDKELSPFILSKNCWVYGHSGIGKSELLVRTLSVCGVKHIYVDLSLCSKTAVIEAFETIYETLCEVVNFTTEPISQFEEYVKSFCKLVNGNFTGNTLYILVDEVPFDQESEEFVEFVEKFCAMINYCSRNLKGNKVFFMLSSIASPEKAFSSKEHFQKAEQYIKFLELKDWTNDEALQLIDLLSSATHIDWSNYDRNLFAEKFSYSPRLIKNALMDVCSLGGYRVSDEIINRILVG